MFDSYKGRRVFLTGDTGFKGSWMSFWLQKIGAEVVGYSLPPSTNPNHFSLLKLGHKTYFEDIRNYSQLSKAIDDCRPEIIFHLAAQPLVRYSYDNPVETFSTNLMGTVNVMEAARSCDSIRAIVIITTDKCYDNVEQQLGYVETDRMGGFDPYSCSKGCAELAVSAYRKSYFNLNEYNIKHQVLIGSARAGNVIGGGDWSVDRLVPDLIKGAIIDQETKIRYPNSTRPWQHVLEPISGYLMLGERLLNGESYFADGWNFGPNESDVLSVLEVLKIANRVWNKINYCIEPLENQYHEAGLLSLNIDKAKKKLGWTPQWNNEKAISKTIQWYDEFYTNNICITEHQLNDYIDDFH